VARQSPALPLETAVRLQGTRPWDQLWDALTQLARDLNLHAVQLDVNAPALHEGFHATWRGQEADGDVRTWRLDLPLAAAGHSLGHVRVSGEREDNHRSWGVEKLLTMVGSFEEQLAQSLAAEAASTAVSETLADLSMLKDTATDIDTPHNVERPVEPRLPSRKNGVNLRTQAGVLNG
jgi:UDP-GlcNAc:undecaprenyl-phosphate GlcNAc-1-phosphate transferase